MPEIKQTMSDEESKAYYEVYSTLSDQTKELFDGGVSLLVLSQVLAELAADISFETSPRPEYAVHVILTAITNKIMERLHDEYCPSGKLH